MKQVEILGSTKIDELSWHLCKVIQDEMATLNLSPRELGAKTKVSYTVIYDFIKRGIIPKVDTLLKLAEGLNLSVNITASSESLSITINNKYSNTKKSPIDNLREALYCIGVKNTKDIEDIEEFIRYKKSKYN